MNDKKYNIILKIMLIYIFLQPIFDILSTMANIGYIINISTYVKPLFIFGLCLFLLPKNPNKKKWFIYFLSFGIYTLIHLLLIYKLVAFNDVIFHEFRFMINIAYFVGTFFVFDTIYYHTKDKEELLRKVKNILLYTIILYCLLYFISVITGSAFLTYSFSDASKKGYRGWYFSGQIFGHAMSICLPVVLYTILKPQRNTIQKILILFLIVFTISLLGTKVPYYITLLVLSLYLIIYIFIKLFNKKFARYGKNVFIVLMFLLSMIAIYKYTPVYYNSEINKSVLNIDVSNYNLNNVSGSSDILTVNDIQKKYPNSDVRELYNFIDWNEKASNELKKAMLSKEIHPSENRKKQFLYNKTIFNLSTFKYKLFGVGYLNKMTEILSIEGDFFMALFNFGIIGFILFLSIPIYYFIKSLITILKNIKICDLEIYMLFMGLGIFFCISIFVGCTYIYTNCSLLLATIILLLRLKLDLIKKQKQRKNKISFLLLHLGYGGIESSTINTANSLCDKYEIELMSFYKLSKNQSSKIDDKINIKYLYNGGPNRDIFKEYISNHKYFKALKEGIKAVNILLKKKLLVINYIINCDSKYIVSTRWDFSILLSKYGSNDAIKIAQEHHYHNNDVKYINVIKNKYNNIDYLFALTKTLEDDYKKFLIHNHHTKVILVPNMLESIPTINSQLKETNIITVSRLDVGKRNDEIIYAFSQLKEKKWKLYIIGDGAEYDNLSKLIKDLNLDNRVILTGYKDKNEIEKYILKSSLFLMASETEGLPMVLLEAMSYGIPCIAYETASGVNDIIKNDYNGYVIKNRDKDEYINKIEKIIKNEKLRNRLGKNAKESSNNFSKKVITEKWYEILK